MTLSTLDPVAIRRQFPSLDRLVGGRTAAFFDGPGGSQVPASVVEAISSYLLGSNANEGGAFVTSRETEEIIDEARDAAAAMLGARRTEIAFGANMTTLNFQLAHAVARTLSRGDEVVVTQLDHEGNVSPWLRVAEDHGLVVRTVPVRPEDGTLDMDAFEAVLGSRTRVVAFTLASNALGTVPDAPRIVAAAHEVDALAWADGVHLAPHRRLAHGPLGLDVLLCSPYKYFGPHFGIAAIREDLAASLPADRVRPAAQDPPGHRFETGTLSHEALAGTVAAIGYLASLGRGDSLGDRLDSAFADIQAYETQLARQFLDGAPAIRGLKIHGIADSNRLAERTPTFLMTLGDRDPEELAQRLGERGFFTWHGDFYAPGATAAVGLDERGAVRIGFLHYNTGEEVDALLETLAELA